MPARAKPVKFQEELFDVKQEHSPYQLSTVSKITHDKVLLHRLEDVSQVHRTKLQEAPMKDEDNEEFERIKNEQEYFITVGKLCIEEQPHPLAKVEEDPLYFKEEGMGIPIEPLSSEYKGPREASGWAEPLSSRSRSEESQADNLIAPTSASYDAISHLRIRVPQQKMTDEQLPIKQEEDPFTWSPGEPVKRDGLGVASEGAEPANASACPQIKEEEPEFPKQQHKREEQAPIKKEKNVTGSTGEPFMKEDKLGGANRARQTVNCSSAEGMQADNVIDPPPDGENVLHDDEYLEKNPCGCKCSVWEDLLEKVYFENMSSHSCFRENHSPDGQEFVGLKELPQIKEEEPEFPQQQMRVEQLPIQKEEDYITWSPCEALARQDDLGGASEGVEPPNTSSWPQRKEEEPAFSQQTIIHEQLPIKNEENFVSWSPGESMKWDDLGVASVRVEPKIASTWLQNIGEEEPEFPQQCKREEQPPIKNEECVKWSTCKPIKSEDDLGVANRGAEPLSGSSTEGWRAENFF
ncbi:uncharacterized protein LOC144213432 isoform X2 [Stigmatopora nigra]